MYQLFNIKDYVVVITGGTGILGRAIARYLALEGAKVIILGRKEEVGQTIANDICREGGCCEFMKTDVLNRGALGRQPGGHPEQVWTSRYPAQRSRGQHEGSHYRSRPDLLRP